jgi:hypothetical protein
LCGAEKLKAALHPSGSEDIGVIEVLEVLSKVIGGI